MKRYDNKSAILEEFGISTLYHIAPLHYFPFISRSRALLARSTLKAAGYPDWHFRRTSHRADATRGFGDRVYLSPLINPPILLAKLTRGFPHLRVEIPLKALRTTSFDLCRFAVARTRYLKRDGKPGPAESASNGRYYGRRQLPVARTTGDVRAMLTKHFLNGDPIEVQVSQSLSLPQDTVVACFSPEDFDILSQVQREIGTPWKLKLSAETYACNALHRDSVVQFVKDALLDCHWKGNGIDFDQLR